jgi:hypothetical protein
MTLNEHPFTKWSASWMWRNNINYNRFCMTTDLFGWAGPAATIGRTVIDGNGFHEVRIADRDGDILQRIVVGGNDEGAKEVAYKALLAACSS